MENLSTYIAHPERLNRDTLYELRLIVGKHPYFDVARLLMLKNLYLLHDIDFEKWPEEHCVKARDLLAEHGIEERMIHAIISHGYGICIDVAPEHEMEKVLFATDELTGLIGAAALMRPSKSVKDMELKSVKKKFKDKAFAAGCNRDIIKTGAERLGWDMDKLMEYTLKGMQADDRNP